jgi:hypothetical protein
VNSCGWALFENEDLLESGTIKSLRDAPEHAYDDRVEWMLLELDKVLLDINFFTDSDTIAKHVVIEKPCQWGAYKSTASQHSGSLQVLTLLVGAMFGHFLGFCNTKVTLIPVSQWKGQLKKEITQKRMETKYLKRFHTNDEADAVGIGDYYYKNIQKYIEGNERHE